MSIFLLNKNRSVPEAIFFFLAYAMLGAFLTALTGFIAGITGAVKETQSGYVFGIIVGTGYCLVLYFLIYWKKRLRSFLYLVLGIISGFVSLFYGFFAGLLFVAFLTTRPDYSLKNESAIVEDDHITLPQTRE